MGKAAEDMTGKKFGKLTVVKRNGTASNRKATYLCRCDCGKESTVISSHLRSGHSQSCGCSAMGNTKHGKRNTPEYDAWKHMKDRCCNPNHKRYHDYGGRGIVICEQWLTSFEIFFADLGQRPTSSHSLDRKDNNGNYEPSNCKWSTALEQNTNRRNSKR